MCETFATDKYKDNRNQEWTDMRLRRLKYFVDNGDRKNKTLLMESFACNETHLQVGFEMLDWFKNGIISTKHSKHSARNNKMFDLR